MKEKAGIKNRFLYILWLRLNNQNLSKGCCLKGGDIGKALLS